MILVNSISSQSALELVLKNGRRHPVTVESTNWAGPVLKINRLKFSTFSFSVSNIGNILRITKSLHHDCRLQTRIIVCFSNREILFITCIRHLPVIFTPVVNLRHKSAVISLQLSFISDKSVAAAAAATINNN